VRDGATRYALYVGTIALLAFLSAVSLQHLLVPQLNPLRHQVSEYANARAGWLMVAGFVAWAISIAAMAVLATSRRPQRGLARILLVVLLSFAVVGTVITASFATQTSAGALPPGIRLTTGGRLHDVGSAMLAVAIYASAIASLWSEQVSPRYRMCTALILALAVTADVTLLVVGPGVGGLRQRILIVFACAWQAVFLATFSDQKTDRAVPHRG
jgi:Protein of unknown function (DUF998)